MARSVSQQADELTRKGVQALRSLTVEFSAYLSGEALRGVRLDRIVSAFARHESKIISGVLGSVGIAGGTWAAVSLWTSSLGMWSAFGYSLGLISMPVWVPVAGGVAGLTAAGGAVYGALSLSRGREQRRKLQCVVGFSKLLLGREQLTDEDLQQLWLRMREDKVDEKQIQAVLQTSVDQACDLAGSLSDRASMDTARYLFPLVYAESGAITDAGRRRFRRLCSALELPSDTAVSLSREYRDRLERQWLYLERTVRHLNYFVTALALDRAEMELLREQLDQLMGFDPRRATQQRRQKLLGSLGGGERDTCPELAEGEVLDEAALMAAYALAQTVAPEPEARRQLADAFGALLAANPALTAGYRRSLEGSRSKVDRLYAATRRRIQAALQREARRTQDQEQEE